MNTKSNEEGLEGKYKTFGEEPLILPKKSDEAIVVLRKESDEVMVVRKESDEAMVVRKEYDEAMVVRKESDEAMVVRKESDEAMLVRKESDEAMVVRRESDEANTNLGNIVERRKSNASRKGFSKLMHSLSFSRKREEEDQNKVKKSDKKSKSKSRKHIDDDSSSLLVTDHIPPTIKETEERIEGVTSSKQSGIEAEPKKLKKENSKSKLASTLVRKMSFGKLKRLKSTETINSKSVSQVSLSSTVATTAELAAEFKDSTSKFVPSESHNSCPNNTNISVYAQSEQDSCLEGIQIVEDKIHTSNNNSTHQEVFDAIDKNEKSDQLIIASQSADPIIQSTEIYSDMNCADKHVLPLVLEFKPTHQSSPLLENGVGQVSQLETRSDLQMLGIVFERSPSKPCELVVLEKPQQNTSVSVLKELKPHQAVVEYKSEVIFTNIEEPLSLVTDMSQLLTNDEASSVPNQEEVTPHSKKKGKGKKSKSSSPLTPEKQITPEEEINQEGLAESSPTDSWTADSGPSSSKSESFFTPKDSPSGMSSLDAENSSSSDLHFSSANLTSEPQPNGEDIMDEARARLSQSFGIANATTATQNVSGDKQEHLYKILVIGELGTGKTSIIKRYVHQFFSQHYRATIGVDFALKVLNWDANTIIRLQLWDIAGQERFGNMTRVYYKEAVGAFIVFDVARAATFDAVLKWKQDLDSKVQLPDGSAIPCILLANKCDQQKEGVVNQPAKMDEYCKERGFSGWFETSAKENINIEEAARALVTKILQNDQLRTQPDATRDGDKFNLDGNSPQDDKLKSKCSC